MGRKSKDRELISRISAGDRESFDYFFSFYFARIYNFISLRVPDGTTGEMLTEMVMSEAVNAFDRYTGAISLDCWMLQITREVLEFHQSALGIKLAEAI